MHGLKTCCATGLLLAILSGASHGQTMTLDEVKSRAEPLKAEQTQALVKGSKVEFRLANGSTRMWNHDDDGTFVANRVSTTGGRGTARGTWKVGDAGEYCLTFDWGKTETESWCRFLYAVEDRYYGFGANAKGETSSGQYYFRK